MLASQCRSGASAMSQQDVIYENRIGARPAVAVAASGISWGAVLAGGVIAAAIAAATHHDQRLLKK